eukprot:2184724-Pleurochrysis_carterae.AAC.1
MQLLHEAFERVLRTSDGGHPALLDERDTAKVANLSRALKALARRLLRRKVLAQRRERMQQLVSWRQSLVDWR